MRRIRGFGAVVLVVLAILAWAATWPEGPERAIPPPDEPANVGVAPKARTTAVPAERPDRPMSARSDAAHDHASHDHGPAGEPSLPREDRALGLQYDGLRRAGAGSRCEGGFVIERDGPDSCTHGPDPAPDGRDVRVAAAEVASSPPGSVTAPTPPPCSGDGTSGNRVQALYVRASGQPDNTNKYLAILRNAVQEADDAFAASARQTGGHRRLRFVTDEYCRPVIKTVTVAPAAIGPDFGETIDALYAAGYDDTDRKVLAFVDADELCGIAQMYPDDRPIAGNYNNGGVDAMVARVDRGCWQVYNQSVAAHEVMHNLGAVNANAPNATEYGHCTDDADLMCYEDGPGTVVDEDVCEPVEEELFDCNDDDYFHTGTPAVGSYLAGHWNTASSSWLDTAAAARPPSAPRDVLPWARGDTWVSVDWLPPVYDGGSPLAGYLITAQPEPATAANVRTVTVGPGSNLTTVTGLANGVNYRFAVQAYSTDGLGPASVSDFTRAPSGTSATPAPTNPASPTAIRAQARRGDAIVRWVPGANGGSPITSWTVTASPGGATATGAAANTFTVVPGLEPDTTYTFTVRANTAAGSSGWSVPSNAVTTPPGPTSPGPVTGEPGDGRVTVTWAGSTPGPLPITGYRVTASPGGATLTVGPDARSAVVTGLNNGTPYRFTVVALDDDGPGTASTSAPVTPVPPLGPPGSVTAVGGDELATVTWTAASPGATPITGYRVTTSGGGPVVDVGPDIRSTVVSGLTNLSSYTFQVQAIDAEGPGPARTSPAAVPVPVAPFASADAFTRRQYLDLVGRAPTTSELSLHRARLEDGTSAATIVVELLRSDAFGGDYGPIIRLYLAYFLRLPDRGGLDYYVRLYREGTSLQAISSGFAGSSEFKSRYGSLSNREFVRLVYRNVLGREADANGLAYWEGQLRRGVTRGSVMVGFSESAEHKSRRRRDVEVVLAYRGLLLRMPSSAERTEGTDTTITTVVTELLEHPDYVDRVT